MNINKTCIVQIGNTDNKLTQQRWSEFINQIRKLIELHTQDIHFTGCSPGDAPWQNFAIIFNTTDGHIIDIRCDLGYIRDAYKQDSIALTIGTTEFI